MLAARDVSCQSLNKTILRNVQKLEEKLKFCLKNWFAAETSVAKHKTFPCILILLQFATLIAHYEIIVALSSF